MSHELRTPLNAILGFAEMLKLPRIGPLSVKQTEYVDDILFSGRHLLDLINSVLDMSKIEAGRYRLDEGIVDLATLMDEAANFLRLRGEKAGVSLRCQAPADLPKLRADRRALLQILLNLLSNATKFSRAGGTVTLTGRREEGGVVLTVSDTGSGISPTDLPRIFEPFQGASGRVSREHGGSGLGLAITRALIEAHGGTIAIDSRVGDGTTVSVHLPEARIVLETVAA
jgi:signal transduction histidine kinase